MKKTMIVCFTFLVCTFMVCATLIYLQQTKQTDYEEFSSQMINDFFNSIFNN